MAETIQRETYETDQVGDQTEVVRTTTTDQVADPVTTTRPANKLIQLVYFIVGVIVALLGIRFVLQLLGASEASGFVNLIYRLTEPLVAPFYGIFQTTVAYGAARLELESLVAMIVYLLIGWGLASLVRLLLK